MQRERVKTTSLLFFKLSREKQLAILLRLNAARGRSTFLQESIISLGLSKVGSPAKAGRELLVDMVSRFDIETKGICWQLAIEFERWKRAPSEWNDRRHESRIEDIDKSQKQNRRKQAVSSWKVSRLRESPRKIERVYDKDNKGLHRHEAKRQRERSQHTPFDESSSRTVSTETFEDR